MAARMVLVIQLGFFLESLKNAQFICHSVEMFTLERLPNLMS